MAIISNNKKFCFVHVGKTGGSTIAYVLNKYAKNIRIDSTEKKGWQVELHDFGMHTPVKEYFEKIPEDYFKFAFVRNPFAVLVSGFNKKGYKDFKKFIIGTFSKDSTYIFNKWTQWEYLSIDNEIAVNFVGRYENFATDWDYICTRLKIDDYYSTLPRKNVSFETNYRDYYDNETRNIVEKKYAKDLEYWGYSF